MPIRKRAGGCASRMSGSRRREKAAPSSIRSSRRRCAGAVERPMTDLPALETELLAALAKAADEPALEAVRVAALGRNGSISALLKTLGTMSREARKEQGPRINGLKDRITAAIAARRDALKELAL